MQLLTTKNEMLGKSPNQDQRDLFLPLLKDFLNSKHELYLFAEKIDWRYLEEEFKSLYSNVGQPSIPLRFMLGCMILKGLDNLGDEIIVEKWIRDPYMQYFCGEGIFQHKFPCYPSDFVHFRKRIGVEGLEKVLKYTVELNGLSKSSKKIVLSDTTVQENNITYPTDAKLLKKVVDRCNKIVKDENLPQRQSYVKVSKQLVRDSYNSTHPRRVKKARVSLRKLKTISSRLLRELDRNMNANLKSKYDDDLLLYAQLLNQKRTDKNKIYSLHKPFSSCIAKGQST